MKWLLRLLSRFLPRRRSFISVVQELVEGLENGTIVLHKGTTDEADGKQP